jgi:hypothetical protein
MRRITMVALVAVLALVGAACGGDDDDSATEDTEASDDGGTTDDSGDDGDDGGAPDGALGEVIAGMGGCTGAAAAVSASMFAGLNPQAAEEIEENREFFDDFESSVPDDIKEDVELFAAYVDAYSEVLGDYSAEDLADPGNAQQIGEDFESLEDDFPPDEIQAASDNISDWFTEECPTLAGS